MKIILISIFLVLSIFIYLNFRSDRLDESNIQKTTSNLSSSKLIIKPNKKIVLPEVKIVRVVDGKNINPSTVNPQNDLDLVKIKIVEILNKNSKEKFNELSEYFNALNADPNFKTDSDLELFQIALPLLEGEDNEKEFYDNIMNYLESNPGNPNGQYYLAVYHYFTNNNQLAVENLEQILKNDPTNKRFLKLYNIVKNHDYDPANKLGSFNILNFDIKMSNH